MRQQRWEWNRSNGPSVLDSENSDLQIFHPLPMMAAAVRGQCTTRSLEKAIDFLWQGKKGQDGKERGSQLHARPDEQ